MLCAFNFAPKGWAMCNGQLMSIQQNQALFSVLGTFYGGDGQTTFGLPDLRGRAIVMPGTSLTVGEKLGTETETITASTMPAHGHALSAVSGFGNQPNPNGVLAQTPMAFGNAYAASANSGMPGTISTVGSSASHNNMMPYLVLNYCIALTGIFPSRN